MSNIQRVRRPDSIGSAVLMGGLFGFLDMPEADHCRLPNSNSTNLDMRMQISPQIAKSMSDPLVSLKSRWFGSLCTALVNA